MQFTVAAPPPSHNSAGITCLHELMRCLKELGHEVHQLDYTAMGKHKLRGILIAPEVFPDIKIPHVRWVLNVPGLLGGPTKYPPGTVCFHYCKELAASAREASPVGESYEFILGHIALPEYIPEDRPLTCYYGGKFTQFGGEMQDHPYAIEIRRDYPATKKKFWELMQMCHTLYSYDTFSAMNCEAHLIGVKVNVWNPEKSIFEDYVPAEYVPNIIWNDESNKNRVAHFVDTLVSKM